MKKILSLVAIFAIFFVSCSKESNQPQKKETAAKILNVKDLSNDEFEYKSGEVTVEGLCIHVCSHSGKKMFIVGDNESDKLQILTSDKISVFDKKLEGSKVQVSGTLEEEKVTSKDIAEMEADMMKEDPNTGKSCATEDGMKEISDMKERIAKSKKGYISFYTLIGTKIKSI